MALRPIMLRKRLDENKNKLELLREKDAEFEKREGELEAAIAEAQTDEEQKAVEEAVDAVDTEKTAQEKQIGELEQTIADQERELEELERSVPEPEKREEKKGVKMNMNMQTSVNLRSLPMNVRAFDALPFEQRRQIVEREDVKAFLAEIRAAGRAKRDLQGGELIIPVVFLDLISENMYRYSKLINRVRVRNVGGQARQTIAGTVPEAVWTEMCGAINELTFTFNQVTLDGYKVAGFIPICNSLLEDSDFDLAAAIVEMLSEAIGLAKDKAILYGKGSSAHMPLGSVT